MKPTETQTPINPSRECTIKEVETRIVKNFLDILILFELNKTSGLSGYDIIESVHQKFGQTLSPGTVYAILYSIERKGCVKGTSDGRKTIYTLTEQGKEVVDDLTNSKTELTTFLQHFFQT